MSESVLGRLVLGRDGLAQTGAAATQGSFTADAFIVAAGSGFFTADAVILATRTGSFTGDAVIKTERSGSFTGDAVIPTTNTGSFTADAWILAVRTGAFTGDADLKATVSSSFTGNAVIKAERTGSFTADAVFETPITGPGIVIRLGIDDITDDVEFSRTFFTCLADGNVGRATVQIRDKGQTFTPEYLRAGKKLELWIDGQREWDGWAFIIRRGWPFEAGSGKPPEDEPRFWVLEGLDRNLLLQKRVLYRHDQPNNANPIPAYPEDTPDQEAILDILDTFLDVHGDGLDMSGILEVASPGPYEEFTLGYVGAPWGTVFDDAAKITGAVFWIGPDRIVHYVGDRNVTAPRPLSDVIEDGATRYREFEAVLEATEIANDALVWGAGVSAPNPVFGRYQDTTSITDHGRWQWSDLFIGGGLDTTVERRAQTYVEGSASHRRGHADAVPVVRCVVWEPGFRVGQVVDFRSHLYDYQENLPIRQMTISFLGPSVVRYELELTVRIDTPFGVPDLWGSPPIGPQEPRPEDGAEETGKWTLVDHFDDQPESFMVLAHKQGATSGTSHAILLPDGSGYEGGITDGITGRQVLLFMMTTDEVPGSGGGVESDLSPWQFITSENIACTHGFFPFNAGHPNMQIRTYRLDVDANPTEYPSSGASLTITSTDPTEILWVTVLVSGVDGTLFQGPSSDDWDIPDWVHPSPFQPVPDVGRRALYFSVAFNRYWNNSEHGLGLNAEEHDTSVVSGGPTTSTGIDGVFTRLVAASSADKTILVDVGVSPINTGSGIPSLPMGSYTGVSDGGSQDFIITRQYGYRESTGSLKLVTPFPAVTGAWPELQPGGNRYYTDDDFTVVDSNLVLENFITMDVATGPWGILDDASGPFSPIAQGDAIELDAFMEPLAPWAFLPLDLLFLLTPPADGYALADLHFIRYDPDGDVSAVIGGNSYRAAWMSEVELEFDFFDGVRVSLYTAINEGTGILPEVHADPNPTDSVDGNITFHKYAPWDHRWDVDLGSLYPWEAGAQYFVQMQIGKDAYDAAAGGWYIRMKMWRSTEPQPDWQVEDVLPMYKPAATTYLGETNITGSVATTTGFEYGYHEWFGDDMAIDGWWTQQGKG